MLAVQQYLQSGKSFDDLIAELGIKVTRHDTLPLAIVNYDQIASPKTHPVVRECRGLVLNTDTLEVVARGFNRFFNWGEVADEMPLFDFSDFVVQEKVDGSFVLLFYFAGRWLERSYAGAIVKLEEAYGEDNVEVVWCLLVWAS